MKLLFSCNAQKYAHGGMMAKEGLPYCTKNGINFYVNQIGKTANVIAKIEDDDVYMLDKSDLREMSLSAKTMGIDKIVLHTNYGLELRSNEKPQIVGFDKIIKTQSEMAHGGMMADGGEINEEEGVDLFSDNDGNDIPPQVQKILDKYEERLIDGMDYKEFVPLHDELYEIGYTFELGLSGEPYDLRKIGQKGKSEFYAKGGETAQKPMSYYKYETPKVRIYWKGNVQPLGMFKSAEDAYAVIKKQRSIAKAYGSQDKISDYEIHTPDKIIKLHNED